ncbi:hypothetical protein V3468_00560 [Flavobacterium oreochromis]|uniref:hypothetical protein n=1 Tax=Flavobacterium oreochromis TaxID=2906078 RepID=UPI003859D193
MLSEYKFIDETDNGIEKIFYRDLYNEYIISIITDFLDLKFQKNEMYNRFYNFLNDIEDYEDVYFLISEPSYHWAISIIYNTLETAQYEKELVNSIFLNNLIEFNKKFFDHKQIKDYLVSV